MIDFLKKIFQPKTIKMFICIFIVLFIGYLFFFVGTDCFAVGDTASVQTKMTNVNTIVSELLKGIYLILRPLLYVCGLALDNSLVYGTWLHLDASLWSLWNIMKNIANFALGVLVLISIVMNLFSLGKGKKKPIDTIKNTVIAGVLIQMSWFLVAAIIDLSTILTYAIGGLPMTVLKTNPDYTNRPIMGINAIASSNSDGMNVNLYYTYGDHKISDCKVVSNLAVSGDFLVGPKYAYIWNSYEKTGFYMDTGYCAIGSRPYRYNHILTGGDNGFYPDVYSIVDTGELLNKTYLIQLEQNRENIQNVNGLINNCVIIPLDSNKITTGCAGYGPLSYTGEDVFFMGQSNNGGLLYTVDNLIENSKGFVGPLITIYSSLLDVQSFVNMDEGNYVENFLACLCKIIFFIILIVPIVGLAIVLICRIGILWLVIAASPILILFWVFKFKLSMFGDKLGKTLDLGNLIKLIFAPVIVTFAISMSLIFITAISSIKQSGIQTNQLMEDMGITKNENTYSILGLVNIELNSNLISSVKDDFAYFITLMISCGIIWFLLMAALKICGNVGKLNIGENIGKKVESLVSNVPIIPLPQGNTSFSALSKVPDQVFQKINRELADKSQANMEKNFPWLNQFQVDSNVEKLDEVLETVRKMAQEKRTINDIESSLSTEQKNLLKSVNPSSTVTKTITDIYYYNTTKNYEGIRTVGEKLDVKSYSNADALKYTNNQLDSAVKSDPNWRAWAASMIGGAVHTSNGVYIVDVVQGTETSNPVYQIVDRKTYEETHFGGEIDDTVKQADLDKFNESQKEKYIEYDKKMKKIYNDYSQWAKKDEENQKKDNLNDWYTANTDFINWLKKMYEKNGNGGNPNEGNS